MRRSIFWRIPRLKIPSFPSPILIYILFTIIILFCEICIFKYKFKQQLFISNKFQTFILFSLVFLILIWELEEEERKEKRLKKHKIISVPPFAVYILLIFEEFPKEIANSIRKKMNRSIIFYPTAIFGKCRCCQHIQRG